MTKQFLYMNEVSTISPFIYLRLSNKDYDNASFDYEICLFSPYHAIAENSLVSKNTLPLLLIIIKISCLVIELICKPDLHIFGKEFASGVQKYKNKNPRSRFIKLPI